LSNNGRIAAIGYQQGYFVTNPMLGTWFTPASYQWNLANLQIATPGATIPGQRRYG
jgi:hypothetical protein